MRPPVQDKRDASRALQMFVEAALARSFTRAAERLGLTPQAVSLQVRELEHALGAVLFARSGDGLTPTPAGERLLALAGTLVRGVDAVFADVAASLPDEPVRLAASRAGAAFVLPRPLGRFRDRYPDIAVRVETAPHREALRRLLDERVDLMLGTSHRDLDERVRYHELLAYRPVLIVPPGHPLAARGKVATHEARGCRVVLPSAETHSAQFGETVLRALAAGARIAAEVDGWGLVKRYVEAGIGVSAVPSLCVNDSDRLVVVEFDPPFPPLSYGVFSLRDRLLTPSARRFLEVLAPNAVVHPPPPARKAAPRRR